MNAAPWWRGAVIYQIYPRSFRDTTGNGVGDLAGIVAGLDYVASLGVDGIWLSPFFTSPMDDFGYDVADYCNVDPLFGTLDDFDELVRAAHERGLKVIIDQVYSHTSDRHPWFAESRQERDNPRADWYVWADARADGSPPNNWQSVFGGPSWAWDARRRQYYLHNFLTSQPDLNLHNPAVQDALLEVTRFWLARGVDGFRLDALNFAMHDPWLRDDPPVADRQRRALATRPFDFQEHRYSRSHPAIVPFIERIRSTLDTYGHDGFTVAEVGGPTPLSEMKQYTEGTGRLHSAYSFDFLYADALTPALVRSAMAAWPGAPGEGWPSWAFSNHDAPRAVSRWCPPGIDPDAYARFALLLLMSLRGNAFLYQGEELGLPAARVPFECLQDPEAIANWPETLGRDTARTPMPWRQHLPHAGFSPATPWLPVDGAHVARAVDGQEQSDGSTLAFTRQIIALRCKYPALRSGDLHLDANDSTGDSAGDAASGQPMLVFRREQGDEQLLCAFHLGDAGVCRLTLPAGCQGGLVAAVNVPGVRDGPTTSDIPLPAGLAPAAGVVVKLRAAHLRES